MCIRAKEIRRPSLAVLALLFAAACGSDSSGGGAKEKTVSCDVEPTGICTELKTANTAKTQATCESTEGGDPAGVFTEAACARTGSVGTCGNVKVEEYG